ncbi:MAG: AAA family ATPase [Candidatus Cloacimonetes bacterium]|nr:AAA family ATPase [Candidatus Cloacimonadota bacterium]MDD2506630.1 AAA family ATPase [Candidatus Cloacimonadota bacterium]MDD4147430.1 AAA family ATPase [Candidatus Cloacimonadota bacterium]MDD4560763.1 AAA family ATPase [Candidatus Cloacimonadota bacterium]
MHNSALIDKPVLILIGGAPGVGKTTLAASLNQVLPSSVWLDGDDLWRMDPFIVNDATKKMVLRHISYVLSSLLREDFQYVIFSWVMHEKSIRKQVLSSLDTDCYRLINICLTCSDRELLKRITASPAKRNTELALDRLATSIAEYPNNLDTTSMSPQEVLEHAQNLIGTIAL